METLTKNAIAYILENINLKPIPQITYKPIPVPDSSTHPHVYFCFRFDMDNLEPPASLVKKIGLIDIYKVRVLQEKNTFSLYSAREYTTMRSVDCKIVNIWVTNSLNGLEERLGLLKYETYQPANIIYAYVHSQPKRGIYICPFFTYPKIQLINPKITSINRILWNQPPKNWL